MSARPARGPSLFVRDARPFRAPGEPARDVEPLDVAIVDGVIAAVGELEPGGLPLFDAEGLSVIPGLVDVHVHFRDPGLAHKEGWDTGSAGALMGGVTSVVEVQNNPPLSISRAALLERIQHVQASSRVDFGCLANLLPASQAELAAMAPLTPAFKCFLGGSTGLGGQADRGVLRELFAAAAAAGRMVVAHCEDEELLAAGRAARPDATVEEHHLVRSSEAEIESVRTAIALAEATGAELHVFHVSTAGACALLAEARARGARVSGSTGPQYVQLSCDDAQRLGNLLKVNPSIKTPRDGAAILAALADGTLDAVGTDHAPHPLAEKLLPYARSPSGMPSVDLLWPLVYDLVLAGRLDARTALASVTWRAAASLHLPRKGRIAPGYDGDLVLFDPDERFVVRGAELLSRSKWSAYEGRELPAPPRRVIRRGELVFEDGRVLVEQGGRPLELEPPSPRI